MDKAHIKGMNHLINVTICISVLSIGLSCVYAGSRTLTALAETGYAPKIFAFVDKAGRPLWSLVFILAFAPLAYINLADVGSAVFDWLVALSGLSTLFTWLAICVTHIRFRRAWKVQGHSVEELPFKAMGGIWGSVIGASLIVIVLIAQFYIVSVALHGQQKKSLADRLPRLCGPLAATLLPARLLSPSSWHTLPLPSCLDSGSSAISGSAVFPAVPPRSTSTLAARAGSPSRTCAPTAPSVPPPRCTSASTVCSSPTRCPVLHCLLKRGGQRLFYT